MKHMIVSSLAVIMLVTSACSSIAPGADGGSDQYGRPRQQHGAEPDKEVDPAAQRQLELDQFLTSIKGVSANLESAGRPEFGAIRGFASTWENLPSAENAARLCSYLREFPDSVVSAVRRRTDFTDGQKYKILSLYHDECGVYASPEEWALSVFQYDTPQGRTSPIDASGAEGSFSGIAGAAGVRWAGCNAPWHTEDWVGNQFTVTLCWTEANEAVSLYSYDRDQFDGMQQEYTEVSYMAPGWGVAAANPALLSEVIANLRAKGYDG